MIAKFRQRTIGILLAVVMTVSFFAVAPTSANAAETPVSITIVNIKQKYKQIKQILDAINKARAQYDAAAVEMDQRLMNLALVRAAELSLYSSIERPNGDEEIGGCHQLISYDIGIASVVPDWKNYDDSLGILTSPSYKSVGVGVIETTHNNKLYVCALFSAESSTGMDTSVYTKSNQVVDQPTKALPKVLSDVSLGFGGSMNCGSSVDVRMRVNNIKYPVVSYLAPDDMNVSLSNPSSFQYSYRKVTAVAPGTSTIKLSLKDNPSISASTTLKAISMSWDGYSFAAIPDQYYTGKPISPNVSVKDTSGNQLVLGTDYTLEYKNNTDVGTATVTIKGAGKYSGQSKVLNFNIVLNTSSVFSIKAGVSPASVNVGSTTTISVSQSGGTAPVNYTYQYALSGSSNWKNISSYTTNTTCSFKPTAAGNYNIRVTAVDKSGKSASQTVTLKAESKMTCTVSLDKASYSIGDTAVITASQQGGSGVTYSFYIKAPSTTSWKLLQDFSAVANYSYFIKKPGEYNILVKFKSSDGKSDEIYKTFNAAGTVISNSSSISTTSLYLGGSVTLKGVAANGSGSYQYAYYYRKSGASSWSTIKGFSTSTSASFKPSETGTYEICIKVKDSTSTSAAKYFTLTCNKAFTNTSTISAAKINLGKSVTVNVSSDCKNTCTYGVWYRLKDASSWTAAQAFSSNAKITVTPSKSGTYEVCAKVKDNTGAIVPKYFTLTVNPKLSNKFSVSSNQITPGSSVTVTCAAAGGAGGYTYLIQYRKSGASSWTVKQNYSTNTSASIAFTAVGTYEVNVVIKDALGDTNSAVKKVNVVAVLVPKLTVAKSSVVCGQSNTVSVSATGGTGGYTYAFYYKNSTSDSWSEKQAFSSNAKVDIKPAKTGTYNVCAKVKDSSGTVQKTYGSFKVTAAVTVKASLSAATIIKGQSTTVTATAANGSGGYQYAIYLKKSDAANWTVKQDFGTNAKLSLKPSSDGKYQVCVKAKDSIGGIAKAYLDITVKPAVENTSTISATSIKLKSSVTVTCSAKNGSGGYTYSVLYKQKSSSNWATAQDFKTNTSVKITPSAAAEYDVCVKAKDSIGGIAKKYFTVKVTA